MHFVLSQNIAAVIPGLRSKDEVEIAAKIGQDYNGLTIDEISRFSFELGDYCCDCGECMPCPQNVNIPAILRFQTLYEDFHLRNWARKLYGGLEGKADKCKKCRECELRCPHNIPIQGKLEKACHELLS
jgi:uncharacterized protein